MIKKDVRSLSLEDLRAFFTDKGFQAFRGNQVYEWLWKKSITYECSVEIPILFMILTSPFAMALLKLAMAFSVESPLIAPFSTW